MSLKMLVVAFIVIYGLLRAIASIGHKCEGRDCIVCRTEAMYP
jgi:hypothetical protein